MNPHKWHKTKRAISHKGLPFLHKLFIYACANYSHPQKLPLPRLARLRDSRCAATIGSARKPRLTLHPNMRDRVRLLQMTLHWHMTGDRHFKLLTGRDISPERRAAARTSSSSRPPAARITATHHRRRANTLLQTPQHT